MERTFKTMTEAEIEAEISILQTRTGEMLDEIKIRNDASEQIWRDIEQRTALNQVLLDQVLQTLARSENTQKNAA